MKLGLKSQRLALYIGLPFKLNLLGGFGGGGGIPATSILLESADSLFLESGDYLITEG